MMHHRRAAPAVANGDIPVATGVNGHHGNGTNGTDVKRKRRKKKVPSRRRPSHVVEDGVAILLTIVIALGISYWILHKLVTAWRGDDSGNGVKFDDAAASSSHGGRKKQRFLDSIPDGVNPMPFNQLYHLPESHELVGDRSNWYAKLRKHYDQLLPVDPERSSNVVRDLRAKQKANDYQVIPITQEDVDQYQQKHLDEDSKKMKPYDIYNCPDTPPDGYPFQWPIMSVLEWSPDDIVIPESIHQGLCVFHFHRDFDKAMTYRNAELPFVVQGDPAVERAVERWNYPGYMNTLMGDVMHRAEFSHNNHFMYHLPTKKGHGKKQQKQKRFKKGVNAPVVDAPDNYKPPTELIRMTYADWLEHANVTHIEDPDVAAPNQDHWYFRLIGCGLTGNDGSCDKGSSEYLYDELTFFQPDNNLYMRKGAAQKGIHCRFGMKGVIAENHFDGSRNAIVVLGGSRRYILSNPPECEDLCLYPNGHPSARHSQINYADPDLDAFPRFAHANANEVVLQPGDVLYLPTHWFHYIVSLELNFQCNSRSGIGHEYEDIMNDCGF